LRRLRFFAGPVRRMESLQIDVVLKWMPFGWGEIPSAEAVPTFYRTNPISTLFFLRRDALSPRHWGGLLFGAVRCSGETFMLRLLLAGSLHLRDLDVRTIANSDFFEMERRAAYDGSRDILRQVLSRYLRSESFSNGFGSLCMARLLVR
jgi:hypothetical protein